LHPLTPGERRGSRRAHRADFICNRRGRAETAAQLRLPIDNALAVPTL